MINNKLPVASHLNDSEYKLLLTVYANHNSSIGLKERAQYNLSEVTKVKRNTDEICLEVHYGNGEWFKYYPNGTWA